MIVLLLPIRIAFPSLYSLYPTPINDGSVHGAPHSTHTSTFPYIPMIRLVESRALLQIRSPIIPPLSPQFPTLGPLSHLHPPSHYPHQLLNLSPIYPLFSNLSTPPLSPSPTHTHLIYSHPSRSPPPPPPPLPSLSLSLCYRHQISSRGSLMPISRYYITPYID